MCTHMHSILIALPACNLNIGLTLLVNGMHIIQPITSNSAIVIYNCFHGYHHHTVASSRSVQRIHSLLN